MNKAIHIIGINFAVLFIILLFYFMDEIGSWVTNAAALFSIFFFVFFFLLTLFVMKRVKTPTMTVLYTIGLSLSGLFFLLNFGVFLKPRIFSVDVVGGYYIFYALIMIGFMIVGLIHSIRLEKNR